MIIIFEQLEFQVNIFNTNNQYIVKWFQITIPIKYYSFSNRSIWPIDEILTSTPTPGLKVEVIAIKRSLNTPKSTRIGVSPPVGV